MTTFLEVTLTIRTLPCSFPLRTSMVPFFGLYFELNAGLVALHLILGGIGVHVVIIGQVAGDAQVEVYGFEGLAVSGSVSGAVGIDLGGQLTLHGVGAHGSGVQQKVNNVVIQQIDFVHIKDATVGHSQHTGLELLLAALDGGFDVQATKKPPA